MVSIHRRRFCLRRERHTQERRTTNHQRRTSGAEYTQTQSRASARTLSTEWNVPRTKKKVYIAPFPHTSAGATTLWVRCRVVGRGLCARCPESPRDLIMNVTARQHKFGVQITAARRACLPVIADDSVPIYNTTGAEPLRAIGIGMAIPRTACVLIGRPVYSAAVLVFNFSTGELVVVRLVGAARPPRQAVVANDVASVRFARCT